MSEEQFNIGQSEDGGIPEAGASGPTGEPAFDKDGPLKSLTRISALPGSGNFVLIGLFVAGIVTVYLLSLRTEPAKASADQLQVETRVNAALSQLGTTSFQQKLRSDGERDVADVFYYEAKHRQIPMHMLQGNPFVFKAAPSRITGIPVQEADPSKPEDTEAQELSEAMGTVNGLVLQSVVTGEDGTTAVISGHVLSKGQRIRGWTVEEIRPREVVIRWKEHTYVLKMSE